MMMSQPQQYQYAPSQRKCRMPGCNNIAIPYHLRCAECRKCSICRGSEQLMPYQTICEKCKHIQQPINSVRTCAPVHHHHIPVPVPVPAQQNGEFIECVICAGEIHNNEDVHIFECCGNLCCKRCKTQIDNLENATARGKCPFCRQ